MTTEPLTPGGAVLRFVVVVIVTGLAHGLATHALSTALDRPGDLRGDGLVFSVGLLAGALAGGLALWLLLRGRAPASTLGFVGPRRLPSSLGLGLLAFALLDLASVALGRPPVPPEWSASFRAADLPLLVLALVGVAPVFEEAVFRGLLHRGLAASRLGPAGAVGLSAVLFALAHAPADLAAAAQGLAVGLVLGLARAWTGSLVAPTLLHAALNARALVLLAVQPAA